MNGKMFLKADDAWKYLGEVSELRITHPQTMFINVPELGCVMLSEGNRPLLLFDDRQGVELTEEQMYLVEKFIEGR